MSKRVTLTDVEIRYVIGHITRDLNTTPGHKIFEVESLLAFSRKLKSDPKVKPKGLLKVHHEKLS